MRTFVGATAAAAMTLLLTARNAHGDDWPSQGLTAGRTRASAERSGAQFRAQTWTYASAGTQWNVSSPAIADGVVVFGTQDGIVHAVRASTGRRLWQFKAQDGIVASPAIDHGRVFVAALDSKLYALRLNDGALVWSKDMAGLSQSSPTIIDDSLILAAGYPTRKVYRIDALTGHTLWETSPDVMAQFSNSAAASDGKQVVIGAQEGHLYSFDLGTGAHRWTYEAEGIVNLAAPLIVGDRLYLLPGGNSGRLHAVALDTGLAVAGWPVDLPLVTTDTAIPGKMLNRSYAVSSLAWAPEQERLLFDVRIDDAMDTDKDNVPDQFVLREFVMAASSTDGKILWQQDNGSASRETTNDIPKNWLCPTPLVFANGATGTSLLAAASTLTPALRTMEVAGGTVRSTVTMASPARSSLALANGRLFATSESGILHAYLSSTNRPPAAPVLAGNAGRPLSATAAMVRWTAALDPDGDPVSYRVRFDRDGEVLESWLDELVPVAGDTTVRVPQALQPGVTYTFAVRARDSKGAWSDWSAPLALSAVEMPSVSVDGASQPSVGTALAAAASQGGTVRLGAGTFYLSEPLRVPPGVSLEGAGAHQTILDATGQATGISIEGTVEGKPTEIKGLTVTGAQVGIAVRDAHDVHIKNVIARDNRETGIEVGAAGSATIVNVTLLGNGRGLRSFGVATLKNSLVTGNQTGVVADRADAVVSKFNDVVGNAVAFQGMARGSSDFARDVAFVNYAKRDLHVVRGQASTDQGDPGDDFAAEPAPNGGRINLGAFGGTAEAELSATPPVTATGTGSSSAGGGCSAAGPFDLTESRGVLTLLLVFAALLLVIRGRRRSATVVLLLACLSPRPSSAITCTWKSSSGGSGGAFSTSANWVKTGTGGNAACPPGASDTAVFSSGSQACSVTADVSVGTLTTSSTYSGTISQSTYNITTASNFNAGAGTFTGGSGDIVVGNDFNLSGGTFTSTNGLLNVVGAFNKTSGTFTHNSGQVLLSATGSETFASNGASFYDLTINDGLVGYWKLDDTATPSIDSSGWGRDATWSSTPVASSTVPTVAFTDPKSLSIDSAADYASFSSPALTTITLAGWIRATAAGGGSYQRVIDMPGYTVFINGAGLTAPDNPMALALSSLRSTTSGEWKSPSNSLTYGAWYHVAISYDSSSTSNVPVMYINGVSQTVTTKSTPVGTQTSNSGSGYIGNNSFGTRYFNGLIDELRIYNRALSATEINSLYIGKQPGTGVGTQTLTGNPTIAHDLVIASGTLAAGTTSINVAGNWWNYGGLFTASSSGLVTFNGSGSTNTIRSAGQMFGAVTINGSGTWTLGDRMELNPASTLTATAGTFSLSSYTLRAGNVDKNGVAITPSTGTVVLGGNTSFATDQGSFTDLRVEPVTATELVGYWKLDSGQGTVAMDYSSGAHDGVITNGPLWTGSGAPAVEFENTDSLYFDGTDDYVDISSTVTSTLAAFSACAWVKPTAVDSYRSFVSILGTNVAGFNLQTRVDTGKFAAVMRSVDNTTSTEYKADSTTTVVANTWYHLCGTYDTSNIRIYVNGTLEGTTARTGTWAAAGGHTYIGAGWWNGLRADSVNGYIDEVRIYNVALGAAQVKALALGRYPGGTTGAPTYTLGANTTVSGNLAVDSGTLATNSYTMNASAAGNVATVGSGAYTVGSATNTFAGGLNVRTSGTMNLATSGGAVAIGSGKTFTMDGTLNASSTGATIQSSSGNYTFTVGSASTSTPTLNITGLAVKNTDTNGMYINAVVGSSTTFTRFDNIAFSAGTGTRLLQIYAPSLYLASNGCTFDTGIASGSTTYNVSLRGDGSATETRVLFGNSTCATNKTPCESYDDDDDSAADGVGDTTGSNAAVIQWIHAAQADTSGTIEGFPVAAFDWNTFTYYSTYVTFHDVGGGTADRIYLRDSNGNPKSTTSYWDTPTGVELIGSPRYDTVSSVHYVYVATTAGKVYRLIDDTTNNTLTQDTSGNWSGGAYDCACTISTPLTVDTNNIYWGGTASGNKVWTLGKTTRALASSSPVTVTAVISGAAPALWTDGSAHVQMFMGSAAHFYKVDINTQTLTTDNSSPTGNVNGRISIISNKVYGADNRGSLWVLSPSTFSTTLWSYHDDTNHNGCASGGTCAVTSSLYVDANYDRAYYGDNDGHLYASYNSTGTTGAQRTGFPFRPGSASDVFGTAPLYFSGILVAGTTTGNLYIIDVNGGSGPVLKQTYKFGATTRISGVGYDRNSSSYMVSTADATSKDGKLVYIDVMADPTPGSI